MSKSLRRAPDGNTQLRQAPPIVHQALNSPSRQLPPPTLGFMERIFARDLSHVRIHEGELARRSTRAVNARAYTVGRDIVLGNVLTPARATEDRRMLAHELAHVLQQPNDGTLANPAVERLAIGSDDDPLEQEARRIASLVQTNRGNSDARPSGTAEDVLRRDVDPNAAPPPPTVFEHNTELGGLIVGNFDFHFRNCGILVWVWVRFKFSSDITAPEQAAFKERFFRAIHSVWANSGWHLSGTGHCACGTIPIVIHAEENTRRYYHKLVDVERGPDTKRRPKVISDINVNLSTSDLTLAHEFGHVLGLYDEYDGGFFENIMFWHRNVDDTSALMSEGTELRPRYFEHYRRRVQETAAPTCTYSVSSPAPPTP